MLKRGISLAEVLVSLLILVVGIVSIYSVFSQFSGLTRERFLHMCLVEATSSALKACAAGASPPATFQCGNLQVGVNAQGCDIPPQNCGLVSARAEAEGASYSLQQLACNLEEDNS